MSLLRRPFITLAVGVFSITTLYAASDPTDLLQSHCVRAIGNIVEDGQASVYVRGEPDEVRLATFVEQMTAARQAAYESLYSKYVEGGPDAAEYFVAFETLRTMPLGEFAIMGVKKDRAKLIGDLEQKHGQILVAAIDESFERLVPTRYQGHENFENYARLILSWQYPENPLEASPERLVEVAQVVLGIQGVSSHIPENSPTTLIVTGGKPAVVAGAGEKLGIKFNYIPERVHGVSSSTLASLDSYAMSLQLPHGFILRPSSDGLLMLHELVHGFVTHRALNDKVLSFYYAQRSDRTPSTEPYSGRTRFDELATFPLQLAVAAKRANRFTKDKENADSPDFQNAVETNFSLLLNATANLNDVSMLILRDVRLALSALENPSNVQINQKNAGEKETKILTAYIRFSDQKQIRVPYYIGPVTTKLSKVMPRAKMLQEVRDYLERMQAHAAELKALNDQVLAHLNAHEPDQRDEAFYEKLAELAIKPRLLTMPYLKGEMTPDGRRAYPKPSE